MYPKTLAEHVRAYLDLQSFLDECRADGNAGTDRAAAAVQQSKREILDILQAPLSADLRPLAQATRDFLEAEHEFDKFSAAGGDLDTPARRMERTRRDLERQIRVACGDDGEPREEHTTLPPPQPAKTPRPRRILVAYDESAPARYALEVALKMVQETGGRLMLMHVVRPATGAGGEYVSSLESLDTAHHLEADEMLTRVRQGLPPSIRADQMVREGLIADEIVAAARAWEAEMIVIGTRGRGRLAQFLLGSSAEDVIRRAPCPVMAVGRRAPWAAGADTASRCAQPREEAASVAT